MGWSFLTNHAGALLHITDHPDARIREIAPAVGITERTASSVVADLAAAGYIVKEREGRRNRYHVHDHLPLLAFIDGQTRVVDMLRLLTEERNRAD